MLDNKILMLLKTLIEDNEASCLILIIRLLYIACYLINSKEFTNRIILRSYKIFNPKLDFQTGCFISILEISFFSFDYRALFLIIYFNY